MTAGPDHAKRYGAAHRRLRAEWDKKVQAGGVACCRCHGRIEPGTPWHLDHNPNDPTGRTYNGPAHPACNVRGVLPMQPIVAHTPPTGPGRGRVSAEERIRRSFVGRNIAPLPSTSSRPKVNGSPSHHWTGCLRPITECTCPGGWQATA